MMEKEEEKFVGSVCTKKFKYQVGEKNGFLLEPSSRNQGEGKICIIFVRNSKVISIFVNEDYVLKIA